MPTEKVTDIIDQAVDLGFRGNVNFHRLSEPFLDKRYVEIAKYAKNKGLKLKEDTNGDVLKNKEDLCKKLDGLLDWIKIGLYDYKSEEEKKQQMDFWKKRFKTSRNSPVNSMSKPGIFRRLPAVLKNPWRPWRW